MNRAGAWAAAVLAASLVVGSAGGKAKPGAQPPRSIILVGWDGADRRNVRALMESGDLPHLAALSREGAIVAIDILRKTDTKAGWAQILTGYEPETTGVFSNGRYRPIPDGYTLFERLEKHFGPQFVTGLVAAKKNNIGQAPPQKKILPSVPEHFKSFSPYREKNVVVEGGVAYQVKNGEPYYHTSRNVDVFVNGLMQDKKVGKKALELLETHSDERFFFFFHFGEIDHKGHHKGEDSKKVHDAYVSADLWTGQIMKKLQELGIADETLVYVTSDHGFDRGMTRNKDATHSFLATNDPLVMRRGERADIAPTILSRFGLDLSIIEPPLDGHTLTEPWTPPIW